MKKLEHALKEYEEYVHQRQLALPKQIPFLVIWVRRFLRFAHDKKDKSFPKVYELFAAALEHDPKIKDWQLRQALDAVSIYGYQFRNLKTEDGTKGDPQEWIDPATIVERLREVVRLRHYSYRTEKTYIYWSRRFLNYCSRAGIEFPIEEKDVKAFLTHLALTRHVSASTQNQAFNALLLLCREVIRLDLTDMKKTVRAKRGRRIPVVLSVEETKRLLDAVDEDRRLMVELLYGAGLRLSELLQLRVKDIDFDNGVIIVRRGKGDEDRSTVLPLSTIMALRAHLDVVRKIHKTDLAEGYGEVQLPEALSRKYPHAASEWKWQWVFPTGKLSVEPQTKKLHRYHVTSRFLQGVVKQASTRAGITKHVSVHTLRHSFATHLLLAGTDIREIQELLGHKSVETTMVYTHVVQGLRAPSISPLDALRKKEDES